MAAEPVTLSRLASVAARTQTVRLVGDDVLLRDIDHDSRRVGPGVAFMAVPGSSADGHNFAPAVVAAGAAAIIVERRLDLDVPQLVVERVRPLMAPLAAEVHGHPSEALTVVGVTGTNGKTTVTHMLEAIADAAGLRTGLIGTIGSRIAGSPAPLGHTTPEATELQRLLRAMVDAGVELVAMEVSSHALGVGRADAIAFDVVAFTNLSQDHLDFHGDMESYFATKRTLFDSARAALAVVFVDDPWGARLAEDLSMPLWRVGFGSDSDVQGAHVAATSAGTELEIAAGPDRFSVVTRLAGSFNAANALVAAACALAVDIAPAAVAAGLAGMPPVPGRFESIDEGQDFAVIVDYAHTPDAISSVVAAVTPLTSGRIIAVGGAGGDRDRAKRPLMGAALARADLAVITSDNPRSEDPQTIVDAVLSGVPPGSAVLVELDRRAAIRAALRTASSQDIVLILGKGHETGQQIGALRIPFDDREVAAEELRVLSPGEDA